MKLVEAELMKILLGLSLQICFGCLSGLKRFFFCQAMLDHIFLVPHLCLYHNQECPLFFRNIFDGKIFLQPAPAF